MTAGISLSLVFHNHQPVGNFGWVIREVWDKAYAPVLAALEARAGIRASLHYSGPLLDWIAREEPEAIDRIRALVEREQVEMLGSGLTEPILVSLPVADRHEQLVRMADLVERLFGRRPTGAWLTERVWEPDLASDLARAGYAYTIVDDNHLRVAHVPDQGHWGSWSTDDQGHRITLLPSEQGLRYHVPWSPVEASIEHLRRHATEDRSRIGVMGDDGEKFGGWPGTHEYCWGRDPWMEHFLDALEENADWISTVRPNDWVAEHAPLGRVYVPATSYVEMTEWALPAEEAPVFHELLAEAKREGSPAARFLYGGFWRAFQTRYREVNDLHKQMLRTSAAVAAMPEGDRRDRAYDHLLRGQSNDVYWHGLFGGIYLVHLRQAVQAELIAAQDLAEDGRPATHLADLDLDGVDEAQLGADGQSAVVDLAEGAGIGAWDLWASRAAVGSSMRRRPESYHQQLRAHFAKLAAESAAVADAGAPGKGKRRKKGSAGESGRDAAKSGDAAATTTEDAVVLKDEGIAELLVYDRHEQRSALVTLRDLAAARELGPQSLAALEDEDLGDFVDTPHEVVELGDGRLIVRREGSLRRAGGTEPVNHRLMLTKRLRLEGDRLAPSLSVELELENAEPAPVAFELDLMFALNLSGGGHNPAAYYEWTAAGEPRTGPHDGTGDLLGTSQVAFGNRDLGLHMTADLSRPARVTWYPIETVSKSEGGFERVYQASSLHLRWPVALAAGGVQRMGVTLRAEQSRDLGAEEEPGS